MGLLTRKITLIMLLSLLYLSATTPITGSVTPEQTSYSSKRVIMIAIDALRFDYLDDTSIANLPGFEWVLANGIRSEMIVSNPTLTAVSHVSISSGANSAVHGIMGNTYYDWKDNYTYSFFDATADHPDPYRNTNTGAYLLNSPQGYHWVVTEGGKSATISWPYSEGANADGTEPTLNTPFSEIGGFVDKGIALQILTDLDTDPDLELIYARFRGVDGALHSNPEGSSTFINSFEGTDEGIMLLLDGLESRNMLEDTTIMFFGDHGMSATTNSNFFIEHTTEFEAAVTATGQNPILAHDSGFSYMYFPDTNDPQKVRDFADLLLPNPNVDKVFVNEEHDSLGMYNGDNLNRGINLSVWFNSDVTRNFGSPFANMHGYLNDNPDMKADFLMIGAGVDTSAAVGGIDSLDLTPTALELLGYSNIPEAQGSARQDIITDTLGPDGSDLPTETVSSTSATPSTPVSDKDDTPIPFGAVIIAIITVRVINSLKPKRTLR